MEKNSKRRPFAAGIIYGASLLILSLCVLLVVWMATPAKLGTDDDTVVPWEESAPYAPALVEAADMMALAEPEPAIEPEPIPEPEPEPEPKPEPQALLSTYAPFQGQMMGCILIGMEEGAEYELKATHLDGNIATFPLEAQLAALIAVPPDAKTGVHTLSVIQVVGKEKTVVLELAYVVQKTTFTRQDLTVTEDLTEIRTDNNINLDNNKIGSARAKTAPMPLWEGAFIQPVEGRISTEFGQVRYTNGQYTSRHSAIDIAAPEGTAVKAPAGGQVVFADELIVSGNTIIIDHGLWLFTTYCHMSALDVAVGDEVKAGDIIGKVGSTGYATGPHLHYAAAIKSTRFNPDFLKEQDPLGFLAADNLLSR